MVTAGRANMARYVGAAVATALAATIYGTVIADRAAAGQSDAEALALVMGRHRATQGTLSDSAAVAAAHIHTLPTSATAVAGAAATSS